MFITAAQQAHAARATNPAIVAQCDRCWHGNPEADCNCEHTCSKMYCAKRYETYDGTYCSVVYSPEYTKQGVPTFQEGQA